MPQNRVLGVPKVRVDICAENMTRSAAPSTPRSSEVRRKTATVCASVPGRQADRRRDLAHAVLLTPIPARLWASPTIDSYTPSNPTPPGPSSSAIALARTIPIPMFRTVARRSRRRLRIWA